MSLPLVLLCVFKMDIPISINIGGEDESFFIFNFAGRISLQGTNRIGPSVAKASFHLVCSLLGKWPLQKKGFFRLYNRPSLTHEGSEHVTFSASLAPFTKVRSVPSSQNKLSSMAALVGVSKMDILANLRVLFSTAYPIFILPIPE